RQAEQHDACGEPGASGEGQGIGFAVRIAEALHGTLLNGRVRTLRAGHLTGCDKRSPMQRFAVFGHPIAHSLSPRLHARFAAQLGIELEYVATEAPPERFMEIAREFFARGGRGANVTLPDKRLAFELADAHTQAAQRAGVANVLTRQTDGSLEAHNTDGA